MTYYSNQLKDEAVNAYLADPDASEEDIALVYGISQTTLSRHLAERGHKVLRSYKTANDRELLEYLADRGITTLNELQKHV